MFITFPPNPVLALTILHQSQEKLYSLFIKYTCLVLVPLLALTWFLDYHPLVLVLHSVSLRSKPFFQLATLHVLDKIPLTSM